MNKKIKIILNVKKKDYLNFKIRTLSYNLNSDDFISFLMNKFSKYDVFLEDLYKQYLRENNLNYTKRMEEAFLEIVRNLELSNSSKNSSDINEKDILKLKNK